MLRFGFGRRFFSLHGSRSLGLRSFSSINELRVQQREAEDARLQQLFDMMLASPSKSEVAVRREELLAMPTKYEDFFAERPVTVPALNMLLSAQNLHGDVDGALDTMRRLDDHPEFVVSWLTFNQVLAAAARKGDVEAFERLYADFCERGLGKGDNFTFSCAAACYMRADRFEDALNVPERAKQAGVTPNAVMYGALLTGFARSGDVESAEEVWRFFRSPTKAPPVDVVMFTAMIHACGKAGNAEKALRLLKEMTEEGILPTEVTYNTLLWALSRRVDMWEEAKKVFSLMKASGYEPNEFSFNSLLLVASRTGDLQSCRRIMSDMEALHIPISKGTLCTFMNGIARSIAFMTAEEPKEDLVAEAEAIRERVVREFGDDKWPDEILLNVYTAAHFIERSKRIFEKIITDNPKDIDPREAIRAYTQMFKLWALVGRAKELDEYWAEFRTLGHKPDEVMCKWLIRGFADQYWINSALEIIKMMVDDGMRINKRVVFPLERRLYELDKRREMIELVKLMDKAKQIYTKTEMLRANNRELLQQKLKGTGVKPYLLPYPTLYEETLKFREKKLAAVLNLKTNGQDEPIEKD